MCGIFGAIANNDVVDTTMNALKLLQYRGYDSVGLATKKGNTIEISKQTGRVENMQDRVAHLVSNIAISHTRWATHGGVTDNNAHPFLSYDNSVALVHNGIIENYKSLRQWITNQSIPLTSDTDSEAIVQLLAIQYNKCGNILLAIQQLVASLVGSFALAIVTKYDNNIYLVRQDSPLCVGKIDNGYCCCSDINTLAHYTDRVATLANKSIAVMSDSTLDVYNYQLKPIEVDFHTVDRIDSPIDSDNHMYNEIIGIPVAVQRSLANYGGIALPLSEQKKIKRIYFVGCGTAYNSGVVVASFLRQLLDIDIHCVIASEFAYSRYVVDSKTLMFFVSQSGETADTIKACEKANKLGAITYAVVNVANSSLSKVAKYVSYIHAGCEIAVASTKAYNCSVVTLQLLCLDLALCKGALSKEQHSKYISQLRVLPSQIERILSNKQLIQDIVSANLHCSAVFFVGRDIDYATAMESSLKLKEISYIHSESYPSGELKHGTLALMDNSVVVVVICTDNNLVDKCNNTIMEVASRGAKVVFVSQYGGNGQHYSIELPVVADICYGCLSVVPMQLFAYYYALALGRDIDKPKNLAKSVTVE